ncbi:N-acetylneuraminate synthase family protein [Spirochaeta isovalerica]|uniref:N-acetylneuraminate synthase n=1 Tax=Spirochaeta isovalerica TaxID=150 RepID=A0A841REM9_9SPIO|nr:N-acetylneuraminate synthase family protein [Spirochaeta isovalerica]MBB6481068.1 N-acetylneuraminate synthase [Spirochaeta isovalerica]
MNQKTYIIAEIGTAHQGDMNKAEELIRVAAETGADCAKFQVVFADEIIHRNTGSVPLPGGDTPLYEVFKKLEQHESFYRELKNLTEKSGLDFLASPFGLKSAVILKNIGSTQYKIASPELNHYPLLEKVSTFGGKIILSTGVSTLGDIELALNITGRKDVSLLHCITAYPAPPEEYNLKLIPLYSQIFGVQAGVSDHSTDPVLVPALATALGASIIEKHFTLSNETDGLDDPIALAPEAFSTMVKAVRDAQNHSFEKTVKELSKSYERDMISAVIGSGEKKLAPSEWDNYERTNRSLHALTALKPGTELTEKNCALLRTEKILRPGISPLFYKEVLGKTVKEKIPDGEGIRWQDIL